MRNVLITGGAGFIGSRLSQKLVSLGYKVRVLDILSAQIHGEDKEASALFQSIVGLVDFQEGTVSSRDDWRRALQSQDIVVHLAAETGTGQSMYEIERYCQVNIGGTALLLDILANETHSVKKVVVASSRAIFGEGKYTCSEHGAVYPHERKAERLDVGLFECRCPFCDGEVVFSATDEESKMHPTSVYGISKLVQEQLVHNVCRSLNIGSIALRYQNVYGPGQSLKNPYTGILSIFSNSLRQNNPINIFEDGLESRDFVYIDDVINATTLSIAKSELENESFNIGTGRAVTVLEIAKLLKTIFASKSTITISGQYRKGDIRHNKADVSKALALLGYSAQITFEEGLACFGQWVKTQPVEQDRYQRSLEELTDRGMFTGRDPGDAK